MEWITVLITEIELDSERVVDSILDNDPWPLLDDLGNAPHGER